MYRVLVVDDEKYIRRSIINRIQWEKCKTEVLGEAMDGREACRMIEQYQPEIVITDIRMPGMDGLALAEWIVNKYPGIRIIIMSAYNDFSYAKKAIHCGVREYLLKPVDEEELEGTLLRLKEELQREKGEELILEVSEDSVENMAFEGDTFFMFSFYLCENIGKGESWELPFDDVCDSIKQPELVTSYLSNCGNETCREKLVRKIWENLEQEKEKNGIIGDFFYLRKEEEKVFSFLWNGMKISERAIERVLKEIKKRCFPEGWVWIGVSKPITGDLKEQEFLRMRTETLAALKEKIFCKEKELPIFFYSRIRKNIQDGKRYKNELLLLYDFSVEEAWENVHRQINFLVEDGLLKVTTVGEVEFLMGELIFVLERIARAMGYLYETRVLFHDLKRSDYLLSCSHMEDIAANIKRLAEVVLSYVRRNRTYDVMEEIRDYVQRYFMEDISVAQIAKKYHLNAAYLSSVFKERNNISLSAYIEGIRMEKAKKFLREDWGNITEVALATGYGDANYFTKVFKKYTGMTPSQWKKKERHFLQS